MRFTRLSLALACGFVLAIALLIALDLPHPRWVAAAPPPTTRYVLADGGANSGDCSDPDNPCKTIQYALGVAVGGDTIRVGNRSSPAVYAGTVFINKSVTLEGGWGAAELFGGLVWKRPSPCEPFRTTIDAGGAGRAISITGSITPTVDCFTITGGDAAGLGGDPGTTVDNDAGGGICSIDAAPIIVNNVITGNYGCLTCPVSYGRGGGIYLRNAPATAVISNNLIAYNVADESTWGQGGGIMLRDSDAQVLSNTITHNRAGHSAGYGGGIMVKDGEPTIADNDVLHNVAGQGVMGLGGGIHVWSDAPTTIERNLVQQNKAISGTGDSQLVSRGGGICYTGDPTTTAVIRDNVIRHNLASPLDPQHGEGGGMYLSDLVTPSVVSGNTLEWNIAGHNDDGNGGGIYVNQSEVTIESNDIFDNVATWAGNHGEGGGIYVYSGTVLIQHNVITRNHGAGFPGPPSTASGYGGGIAVSGSMATIQDNRIAGNNGTNAEGIGLGGGIYGYQGTLRIAGNGIAENRASAYEWGYGGGLYLWQTLPSLEGNTIVDNVAAVGADGRGGGVRVNDCPAFTLTNNIVARNEASALGSGVAIAENSVGELVHNTIAENTGGDGVGVHVNLNSDVALYNNIIFSHTVGITNADIAGSNVGAKYTLFEANGTNYGAGVGSTYEVPGPARLLPDYHLGGGSNAIDQAITLAEVTTDIDGDTRPIRALPDVGADEAWWWIFLPLVLHNPP